MHWSLLIYEAFIVTLRAIHIVSVVKSEYLIQYVYLHAAVSTLGQMFNMGIIVSSSILHPTQMHIDQTPFSDQALFFPFLRPFPFSPISSVPPSTSPSCNPITSFPCISLNFSCPEMKNDKSRF